MSLTHPFPCLMPQPTLSNSKKKKKSNREEEERKSDNDNEAFKLFDFLFGPRTKTTEKNSNPGI